MPSHSPTTERRIAGLSLMETVVVIGVMTIILLMVTEIFTLSYTIYQTQARRAENEAGAILVANAISRLARGAISVEPSHVFDGDTITSSATAVVFRLPAIDGSGDIVANIYDYVGFYRNGTETDHIMVVTDAADTSARVDNDRRLTEHNVRLDFRYNEPTVTDASRVSIYVQNTQSYKDTVLNTEGWTSIFMRNK